MKNIKLFEQFSIEEYEFNKIYENWSSQNGDHLRMLIEQLDNEEESEGEEDEGKEDDQGNDDNEYNWLEDVTLKPGELRALARDYQVISKGQLAALYLKAKGKFDNEGPRDARTREARDRYVVGIPGILDFCRTSRYGVFISAAGLGDAIGLLSLTTVTRTVNKFYQILTGIMGTETEIIYKKLIDAERALRNLPIDEIQTIAAEVVENPLTSNTLRAQEPVGRGPNLNARIEIGEEIFKLIMQLKTNDNYRNQPAKTQRAAINSISKQYDITQDNLKSYYKDYLIKSRQFNNSNFAA